MDAPEDAHLLRAYQFALRPSKSQAHLFARWSGQLRWIWNQALAEQNRRQQAGEKYANYFAMCKWLTAWRNSAATTWLQSCPAEAQQVALKRLHHSFQRFFKACKGGPPHGRPSFKGRKDFPGITCVNPTQVVIDADEGLIRFPKVGWIKVRLSRPVEGEIRNATIHRDGSDWLVTIQARRLQAVIPSADVAPSLGLDLGVHVYAAGSDGRLVAPLSPAAKERVRERRYQRAMDRKKSGSRNWTKAARKLANLRRRVRNRRRDWLHKLTTSLANEQPVIAIEDLKVQCLTRSSRGSAQKPGRRIRVKAAINRAISDQAWGTFAQLLDYKLRQRGGALIRVHAHYSSQTCPECGHVAKENRTTRSAFICTACGYKAHADTNAAVNILARGNVLWKQSIAANPQLAGGLPVTAHGGDIRHVSEPATDSRGATPAKWENAEDSAMAPAI